MNCLVCGKKFTWWRRVTGDADDQVCRECEKEGMNELRAARQQIRMGADLRGVWSRMNSAIEKYRIPAPSYSRERGEALNLMFEAAAEREPIANADVEFLNEITLANRMPRMVDPGTRIGRAVYIIKAKATIANWAEGQVPRREECRGLLLGKNEMCHWEEPAKLYEQRTRRQYVGRSQGVSIRLARGLYYRVGAFKGEAIDTTYLSDCGSGTLHITSSRICFTGEQQSVAIAYSKIINVAGFQDGFQIFRTGAKKPTVLQVLIPELTLRLLGLATPAEND